MKTVRPKAMGDAEESAQLATVSTNDFDSTMVGANEALDHSVAADRSAGTVGTGTSGAMP